MIPVPISVFWPVIEQHPDSAQPESIVRSELYLGDQNVSSGWPAELPQECSICSTRILQVCSTLQVPELVEDEAILGLLAHRAANLADCVAFAKAAASLWRL